MSDEQSDSISRVRTSLAEKLIRKTPIGRQRRRYLTTANKDLDHVVEKQVLSDKNYWTYSQGSKSSVEGAPSVGNFRAQGIKIKPKQK